MTVAVDWLAIKNDYINGGGSYRKLAEKYGVNKDTIARKAKDENWRIQKDIQVDKIQTEIIQQTSDIIVEKAIDRISRLLAISDQLVDKIGRAVEELELSHVVNKTKTKVIEYNNDERPDKPTKEVIEEKEELIEIATIIDRKGLQQVTTALKTLWDISVEDSGVLGNDDVEDDPLTKALKEEAERLNDAD